MFRRILSWVLLTGALLPSLFSAEAPVRIMPLGDSNTLGYSVPTYFSGYRDLLYALLDDTGYTVDFVGTQIDTQNSLIPDPHHEGHGGFRIDQINNGVGSWLNRVDDPDVVLLMIGTNDFLQNYQTAQAPARLEALVEDIALLRPFAKIIVANLVPNTANASIESAQVAFSATIPAMVDRQVALGRDVTFVDVHSGMTAADMSSDGIHPTEAGYDKLANRWFDAITPVISPAGTDDPPQIARVESIDPQHVAITFSKPVQDAAATPANFSLSPSATISGAALDAASKRVVTLTTSTLPPNTSYTLGVSGVRDRTPAARLIAPGSTFGFVTPFVANGSFEFGSTAWTQSGNQVITTPSEPYHKRNVVVFNGAQSTPNGVVSQTFATVAGQSYRLEFALGVLAYNKNEQRLLCTATGSAPLLSETISIFGRGSGQTAWELQSLSFVADSAATTIRFQDVSPSSSNLDLMLDDVRVSPLSTRALTVASSPASGVTITVSPADTNGAANGTTQFVRQYNNGAVVNLTAPGTAGASAFQKWQRNGVDFSTNTGIAVTMNASYTLTAVYAGGAPAITAEPQTLTAATGSSATFTVSASGAAPLSYQWRLNGTAISGATSVSYTIPSVATGHAGNYSVVVTNGSGTATSTSAPLTVVSSGRLANGSFESAYTAWTATGNQTIVDSYYPVTDGSNVLVLNGGNTTPNGTISQRFTTTAGQTYILQFDVGVLAFNTNQQRLQVNVQGSAALLNQTVSLNGLGGGATRWSAASYNFTADSSVTTITFTDVSTTTQNIDLLLDNVRIGAPAGPTTRTLTVGSSPASGVTIGVSPADNNGAANGTTSFTRTYNDGTTVALTAPATASGNAFEKWQKNGADFSTNAAISVTLTASDTYTAVYASAADSFSNGSFESGYTGWTTSGNQLIASGSLYAPTDGTDVVLFNSGNSTPNAVLSQTFATTTGQTYTVQLDVGVRAFNKNQQRLQITVQGASTRVNQTVSVTGVGSGTARWTAASYVFTADSSSTTLTLRDTSATTNSIDLMVDNIRVTAQAAPTTRTLTVASSPSNAVAVTVSPADNNGATNGTTSFTRVYNQNTVVTLTAPATVGGNAFQKWQRDGVDLGTTTTINVTLDANHTLTAVYATPASGFTNGSFESDYTGWTASGNEVLVSNSPPYVPTDGDTVVAMNGGNTTPNAVLSQTFATVSGRSYTVRFDAGVLAYNKNTQRLRTTVAGTATQVDQTLSITGLGGGAIRWVPTAYTFTADSTSTTLTFRDVSTNTIGSDLLLDHVRIE